MSGTANLVYDSHGNITTLGNQVMTYDQSDRHISTVGAGATVTYIRDVTDRIIAETSVIGATTKDTRFGFTDGSDSPDWTINADTTPVTDPTAVLEHTLPLPGGVVVSIQAQGGTLTWSYPNMHGDSILTTNLSGTRQGLIGVYDPFGQPIDPTTFALGTTNSGDAVPTNTLVSAASNAREGSHQKLYQHAGDIAVIEMGARQYVPGLGRFLSTDPIAGGNANDYNYPNDPENGADLTGQSSSDWVDGWYVPPGTSGVYVLEFADGSAYVGRSKNIQARLYQHNRSTLGSSTPKTVRYREIFESSASDRTRVEQMVINDFKALGAPLRNKATANAQAKALGERFSAKSFYQYATKGPRFSSGMAAAQRFFFKASFIRGGRFVGIGRGAGAEGEY